MKAALDLICRFASGIISLFQAGSVGTMIMQEQVLLGIFFGRALLLHQSEFIIQFFLFIISRWSHTWRPMALDLFLAHCALQLSVGHSWDPVCQTCKYRVHSRLGKYDGDMRGKKGNMIGRYSIHQYMTRWSHTLRDIQSMNEKGIWSFQPTSMETYLGCTPKTKAVSSRCLPRSRYRRLRTSKKVLCPSCRPSSVGRI